ncbi:MAG: hypothetical protein O2956_10940 [Gemmatimonadetes bacterium]|nr:hypothetical protein [Gemmatimonadota bacterium]
MAQLPDWRPLSGAAPSLPDAGGAGRVVVVVASEQAVAEGWAASAALDLARSWSRSGQRVILIDGALQQPTLHQAAGVPNREGLTDATLFGASVGRVSQAIDDGAFFLISAGTVVADTNTVVRSARWHRLSSGMAEAGVTVALYVRDGESGTAAFLGSASDIVVLAAKGERAPNAVRDLEPLVRAVTGPAVGAEKQGGAVEGARGPKPTTGGVGRMVGFVVVAAGGAAALGFLLVNLLGGG